MTDIEEFKARGPLADLRVVEMGQLLAGPFCGQLLADFGAEVIKIEQPGSGDPMREWGQEKAHGQSLWWPIVARNKKCITVNARVPEGQALVRDLVAQSDILLENFRPGTMERWNLGYEALARLNPRLIMIRVSGFGQTGPYAPLPGYASIGEAMGGLRHVVGYPDQPPCRVGISLGDSLAAIFGMLGALMALHARQTTGRGQVVDATIYESVFALMESLVAEYAQTGYVRERTGPILPNVAPANVYPTSDGEHLIAANQDSVFRRLAATMGRPELADDPRYASHGARGSHQRELDDLIGTWTRTLSAAQLRQILNDNGVPNGKIYTAADIIEDAHYAAREAIIRMPHPAFRELRMQNTFPKLSDTPGRVRWCGPGLGEHNAEIFGELLGLDPGRIAALEQAGVI
ncbi:MAG: CoA transferase [Gammaproteobacteria bacterium]|nr:CoA transferase [Gammaproteobacteria bacterium]